MENDFDILFEFLSMNVNHSKEIFEKFRALPDAIEDHGPSKKEGYLYLPGKRADRCLLVAHTDTAWDNSYDRKRFHPQVLFSDGVFSSSDPDCGIGADDRAGCAMLWLLRHSGHSLLLVDGEEHGQKGAHFLLQNDELKKELNSHTFIAELDRRNANEYKTYDLPVSKNFLSYIESETGFVFGGTGAKTDIAVLCLDICGVNLSVGYEKEHTSNEILVYAHWKNTLDILRGMLQKDLPRFPLEKNDE